MTKTKTWEPIQLPDFYAESEDDSGLTGNDIESDFLLNGVDCCGIREFAGIQNGHSTRNAMIAFMYLAFQEDCAFSHVIFSETQQSMTKTGEKLAAMIRRRKLGTVTRSQTIVNPNSANLLTVWLWAINWKAVKEQFKPFKKRLRVQTFTGDQGAWYGVDRNLISS